MKSTSEKYFLANHNGTEIHLVIIAKGQRQEKYYLDYYHNGRKKYYGNGTVKRRSSDFFEGLDKIQQIKLSQIESLLANLFKEDIALITSTLHVSQKETTISLKSTVKESLEAFYKYKSLQKEEGTLEQRSLTNYGQYQRKLLAYLELEQFTKLILHDLSSSFWVGYRIELLNNSSGLSKRSLSNASINQHFQYITQLYSWLMDYLEVPIKNHLKKLNKLNEAKQKKRFKVIPTKLLKDFYSILEHQEKYRYTRLYLSSLLLYENNIRLSEQVLATVGDINLDIGTLSIVNKKNDSVRTVLLSPKSIELIAIIKARTVEKGITVSNDMYLFGGYNTFKSGKPHSYKELGTLMRSFRKLYPQFKGITLYEQKHTSITNQFDEGIDHYQIKERANHSSISTTEIYLQSSKKVQPYKLDIGVIDNDGI